MSFRTRLMLSSLVLVLLSTVPLCVYSVKVISSSMQPWTNSQLEAALQHNLLQASNAVDEKDAAEALVAYKQLKALSGPIKQGIVGFSVALTVAVIGLSLGCAWWFAGREARPLRDLVEATSGLTVGEMDVQVSAKATGEVALLVNSFNAMVSRLRDGQAALARAERRAAWESIARAIAHEIKNPLTPMRLSAQRLREKYIDRKPDFEKALLSSTEMILSEIDRLERLANEFSRFARIPPPHIVDTNVDELIASVGELYEGAVSEHRISFHPDGSLPGIKADPEQIKQVCVNLVENGLQAATQTSGMVSVRTYQEPLWVGIEVSDTGCGMSEDMVAEIFTPYFTTRRDGSGIGLSIVERIVTEHNGCINVASTPGMGTAFRVLLPKRTDEHTYH